MQEFSLLSHCFFVYCVLVYIVIPAVAKRSVEPALSEAEANLRFPAVCPIAVPWKYAASCGLRSLLSLNPPSNMCEFVSASKI
jgi:hypothetical protein